MKVTWVPYVHPGEKPKGEKPKHDWYHTLVAVGRDVIPKDVRQIHLHNFAPIGCFHEAPLRSELVKIKKGVFFEIELPPNDKIRSEMVERGVTPIWIAEVVHMIGYYILLRWVGAQKTDGYFWIHCSHAGVHAVGYAERQKKLGTILIPPYSILETRGVEEWPDYMFQRLEHGLTVTGSFDGRVAEMYKCKFKAGERVETVHDDDSTCLVPAIVRKTCGRRVLLEYSKSDIDKDDLTEKENVWKDSADDFIFPVGFASTMGLGLKANKKYRAHAEAIAKATKEGSHDVPYARNDASREKVCSWRENKNVAGAEWEANMVLEIIDRLDYNQNLMKAARVLRVLPDGYLQMGPEGPDISDDAFTIHSSSPLLFPVGFSTKYGVTLTGPKGDREDAFNWDSFLKRTNYRPAPASFFHEATEADVPFKVGMRLEAIDQNEKMLCPGSVKAIFGRLLLVSFDGWDDKYDQLYDFRSNELQAVGWGEMVNHVLQPPEATIVEEEKEMAAEEVNEEGMDTD